ncbi:ribosomal-protein-alanine N-acetyltransferase [Kineosphaera limosa]|uniref:Putative ribosomal-protein-alanine acetyltransferase n=1 Tax=Kineosphaera limosa NBRC 100340 TaxID=1184609 RepID=K6X5M5_9MICO|nr:ribosomal protein S18-alanine N-acetyltransferase [Kineosphaera limosa]NYE02249.1 ribosomal-protein-alanine N-acetyltransferase [Kineosphaera limosa]GAB94104.1 putative ribosomal-protein-alanine acetyltransferase [Kineosphaera limosa NBRC 100340]
MNSAKAPATTTEATEATEVTLRETRWQDLQRLADLESELFGPQAWSLASWWGELAARPRRAYVTAVRGGEIVGYAGVDRGGAVADVMTIAVTPAARGLGLGRRLLHRLVESAEPAEALLLEVRADNAAARALYDSEGFEVVTVRRRYYGEVDALVLRRHLGAAPGAAPGEAQVEAQR